MPRILIVDDSRTDTKLIAGLLTAADQGYEILWAQDGERAVAMVLEQSPDLVVTDMVMPGLNGLGLVERLASDAPAVPVVLTTSRGTEELAVEALERGADGYIPKGRLGMELVEVVERVLAAAEYRRQERKLMQGLTSQSCTFDLPTDHHLFRPLIQHLQGQLARIGFAEDGVRTRIGLALEEAMTNAHVHGNLGVDSSIRETDFSAYFEQIDARMGRPPYRDRRIRLESHITSEEARFVIRDEGAGFDPASLPDPTWPENLERAAGRGILLMRTFMDAVEFSAEGRCVEMRKRATGAETPGPARVPEREEQR